MKRDLRRNKLESLVVKVVVLWEHGPPANLMKVCIPDVSPTTNGDTIAPAKQIDAMTRARWLNISLNPNFGKST